MQIKHIKCSQRVGSCAHCNEACIKYGKSRSGNQRYRCKSCGKTQVENYKYPAYEADVNSRIKLYLKEGCGIRSISRILNISISTVLRRIRYLAMEIKKPILFTGKEYELDELCTYVQSKTKKRRIVYALRKDTGEVADFSIGSRTNKTLKKVTDTLVLSNALKVFTDKLPNYRHLLPATIHSTKYRETNYIERKNLTIRTHLKRLSRRTICFSKSEKMLAACLKIYFWG